LGDAVKKQYIYVEIEGAVPAGKDNSDNLPEIESLTGLHTCNSADEAGSFVCSKPMFNQIHSLIDWAIRSNMASVLTIRHAGLRLSTRPRRYGFDGIVAGLLEVSIPANSTAEIYLPTTDAQQVSVYGLPLSASDDITVTGVDSGNLRVKAGSGDYRFRVGNSFLFVIENNY
jgi:hypothetical protein